MKKQRLLTLAIVICLLACLFTACGTNVDADNKDDDPVEYSVGLAYSVNTGGGTCTITGTGTCIDSEISIPKEIDGYTVTAIAPYAFYNNSGIITVLIPEGVTSIGDKAFYNCSSLTSIIIPDSVTSIGIGAFGGCESLTSITLPFVGATKDGEGRGHFGYIFGADTNDYNSICVPDSLKEVVITGGTIGSYAFYECRSLISVTIGNSVTYIGKWAFDNCRNLTNVIFKDPNGWYVIDSHDVIEERTRVTLTNKTKNATYLRSTYGRYYWYKS